MFDLAEVVPLGVDIKNAAGVAVNAAAVTLTITLPDGTSSSPAPTNPSTGRYEYDYTSTQAGRHIVRWVATNPNTAYTDAFDVREAATQAIISVADAKKALKVAATDTTYDEELRNFVDAVTDVVEDIVGSVVRRTVTETHSGPRAGSRLLLRRRPIVAITSVTESGTLLGASDYSLSDGGVLTRSAAFWPLRWQWGVDNIVVVYVVARAVVPPSILEGARELVRINFRPQQGGNYSPYDEGAADDYGTPEAGTWRLGFFIPNRVMQMLKPHERGPDVA